MRRSWILLGLALAACQSQSHAPTGSTPSPTARSNVIYVADNGQMTELDWSGNRVGSVSALGFSSPSPDGSRFLRSSPAGDRLASEDSLGRSLGPLDLNPNVYGLAAWADDGKHICGIVFPTNRGSDSGSGSLWIGAPGEHGRVVAPVGGPGSSPAVASCSIEAGRAVVVWGDFPHWPPQAERHLITTRIKVIDLASGASLYEHTYTAGEANPNLRPDWILDTVSPDGRYVAETGVFANSSSSIRDLASAKVVATLPGAVVGFDSQGSRVVMNNGPLSQVQLLSWKNGVVTWHRPGLAQQVLARPGSDDLLLSITSAAGAGEIVSITEAGTNVIAGDAAIQWPCPCRPGP